MRFIVSSTNKSFILNIYVFFTFLNTTAQNAQDIVNSCVGDIHNLQ